jgi:hypothetical protein
MVQRSAHNSDPCAKRRVVCCDVVRRDAVDRDELVALDFDLGDVGFHDGFALAGGAVVQDVGEAAVDLLDRGRVGWLRR